MPLFGGGKCRECGTKPERIRVLPEARAAIAKGPQHEHDVEVELRNVPARECGCGATRRYPYADFGHELRMRLIETQSDDGSIRARFEPRDLGPVDVVVRLPLGVRRSRSLESDISDALIAAFDSIALKP